MPINSTYFDKCDVSRLQNVLQPNGSYKQQRVVVASNINCALSIGQRPSINSITKNEFSYDEVVNQVNAAYKVYMNPTTVIQQGDELTITHNGRTVIATAGLPYVYDVYQVFTVQVNEKA